MIDSLTAAFFDAILDSLRLLPFLYLAYALLEYVERRAGAGMELLIAHSGRFGPLYGAVLGLAPQCGLAAVGANLYAARLISLGTLLALFLSASDEMLPIMVAAQVPASVILPILGAKLVIAMAAGWVCDLVSRREKPRMDEFCQTEGCGCRERGLFRAALYHTLRVALFIFLVTLGLNILLDLAGESVLSRLFLDRPLLGPVIAAAVGLIPNCASSVALTNLYLAQAISGGALLAGLLPNCGVGLLVLFRANPSRQGSLLIMGLLYAIGVLCGWLGEIVELSF